MAEALILLKDNTITKIINSKWAISVALFLVALLPRLPDLGRFLTPDEFLWVDRSRNFLAALTDLSYQCSTVVEKWDGAEGLACTLRTGHPGVTTMWTGSFGFVLRWLWDGQPASLHDYVVAVSTNPLDANFIAPERLGTVLFISMWVVVVYWLACRLFGDKIALVGTVLIALDPFHVALSRVIHHDALSTAFMTLSAMTALIYWGQNSSRKWLILSGAFAGFGFLSKSPALYLMPFIALTGLWFFIKYRRNTENSPPLIPALTSLVLDGLLWFAISIIVVFIFWPAMWVIPIEAIQTVIFTGNKYATGGHAKGNYFLGEVSQDPGALFYPITWLYRVSPLVLLGILTVIYESANKRFADSPIRRFVDSLPLILMFIGGYYLLMTIGGKKQDRYFLPAYIWLNFIAAAGLVTIFHKVRISRVVYPVLLVVVINGWFLFSNYPYYFTYYNPLMGGIKGAEKVMTIGWGEGLDQAAVYLNQKSGQEKPPRVASWYQSTFAPFYKGQSISYSKEKGKALAGDYVIFYINQTQRRFPDKVMFDYFESRFQPEKIINLKGVDYVWIYPSLGVDHYIQDQTYTDIASLLAWQWEQGDIPLIAGQQVKFELYWEYLGKGQDEPFFFRLVDAQNRLWAEGESRPAISENPPVEQWRKGEIIATKGSLSLPADIPPGQYRLKIGFYTKAPAVTEGELLFSVSKEDDYKDEDIITIEQTNPAAYELPQTAIPINQPLGDRLTLLGASYPSPLQAQEDTSPPYLSAPTDLFPVDLYWQVEQPLPADSELHLGLMDSKNEPRHAWFNLSIAETFNPTQTIWQPGDIIHTRWYLDLPSDLPAGGYHFEAVLPTDIKTTLSFGELVVE